VIHGIEAYEIGGLEGSGLGTAHGRAEKRVDFGNGQTMLEHGIHCLAHALDADPVADEIGGVFCPDDSLAQVFFTEISHNIKNFLACFRPGDNFQEVHVTNRVEKVGSQKMLFHIRGSSWDMSFKGMPEVLELITEPGFRTPSILLKSSCLILRFSTTTSTIQSQSASLSKSSSRFPMKPAEHQPWRP
jgi:hypothetical protein